MDDRMPIAHHAQVLPARAAEAEPGDEVLWIDPEGNRRALRAEYVLARPGEDTVTVVARRQELTVPRESPVLLVRGADELWGVLGVAP